MKRRPRDWEVIVRFNGQIVEHYKNLTRLNATMTAGGLNSTFARGSRVVQSGGPFKAPVYETTNCYALARRMPSA